jgi:hypothetical protein
MRQLPATQYVELMVRVVFSAWMFTFRKHVATGKRSERTPMQCHSPMRSEATRAANDGVTEKERRSAPASHLRTDFAAAEGLKPIAAPHALGGEQRVSVPVARRKRFELLTRPHSNCYVSASANLTISLRALAKCS